MPSTRPATISELAAAAQMDPDIAPSSNLDLKYYIRRAETHRKDGKALGSGTSSVGTGDIGTDLELAFIEYACAAALIVQKVPAHRDFTSALSAEQRANLTANGEDILHELGRLKSTLVDRYERYARSPSASADSVPAFTLAHNRAKPHFDRDPNAPRNTGTGPAYPSTAGVSFAGASAAGSGLGVVYPNSHERVAAGAAGYATSVSRESSNASSATISTSADSQTTDRIDDFVTSWERRGVILSEPSSSSDRRADLENVYVQISTYLTEILDSRDARRVVVTLQGQKAQSVLDAVQNLLDRGSLSNATYNAKARKLIQRLSEARNQLPASLFITGVTDPDEHPTFAGGFGDVYRASYGGQRVALKRIRTFAASSTANQMHKKICKEALVWQGLRHQFILPFLGIDRRTFPSAFCLVAPWMKNGTVLKYLKERGLEDANRLLLEIAQGLEYLHSKNIVHGDLRGSNILISDDLHACLADFGLATTFTNSDTEATTYAPTSSNHAGSVRWFAPELISPQQFGCEKFVRTPATDVYAFACVCVELHTGNPPFSESVDAAAMLKVIAGERPDRPVTVPDGTWNLVTTAWAAEFHSRPKIGDIARVLEGTYPDPARLASPTPTSTTDDLVANMASLRTDSSHIDRLPPTSYSNIAHPSLAPHMSTHQHTQGYVPGAWGSTLPPAAPAFEAFASPLSGNENRADVGAAAAASAPTTFASPPQLPPPQKRDSAAKAREDAFAAQRAEGARADAERAERERDPYPRLRMVVLPLATLPRFLAIASANTACNLETCGLLLGREFVKSGAVGSGKTRYIVETLLIPKQHATSDTCTMDDEEGVLGFTEERGLITIGWIHTHPSQSCFMSSVDLHTHASFQRMLPESFAVVCAPKSDPSFGIFRLTDPPGLQTVLQCTAKQAFHPHPNVPIYTDADKGHVQMRDAALEIVDLR